MEPDRVDTTAEEVLDALLLRLRTFFALSESTCFACAEPRDVSLPPGGQFFVSVSIWNGDFDGALQIGGGYMQCTERLTFGVSIYTRAKLDRANQDPHAIRRLLQQKRRLLACLCAHDLQTQGGDYVLRQHIPIETSSPVQVVDKGEAYYLTVYVSCEFDWDIHESSSSDDSVSSSSTDSTSSSSTSDSSSSSSST